MISHLLFATALKPDLHLQASIPVVIAPSLSPMWLISGQGLQRFHVDQYVPLGQAVMELGILLYL